MDIGRSLGAPGDVQVTAARRAAADEHRVPLFRCIGRDQLRQRIDAGATAELDAAVEDVTHFLVDDAIGKPELGNLRAHHAAGLRVAVENDAFVAERREIARDGQ